ncbi:MAG TPA: glycoside hydrolase family 38 C-terminal domain-containing protein [Kofleriaceae bacterium]|nr:glycoside hydrolase family 38 C-terminal domain-containing protein [Kofleriaceae bacterium]
MQRHPAYTRKRLEQLSDRIRGLVWADALPIEDLVVAGPTGRIRLPDAERLDFRPARRGEAFGPAWATYWFRARAQVPAAWAGRRVDLYWMSHSEATLWVDGRAVQGLNHEPSPHPDGSTRADAPLLARARGGESLELWIEMACNQLFGQPERGKLLIKSISPFVLERCDLVATDVEAWDLHHDFEVLRQLEAAADGALERSFAGELLAALNGVANTLVVADRATWGPARDTLRGLYARAGAGRALELSAVGHAHIDTAWLWPIAETVRKCERTFSSQVALMDRYPEHRFACSQAQQWAWMKAHNPDLWQRIVAKVKTGQFIPAGGTWVEPDCNVPSGESLVRQLLQGQRFFERELGVRCREMWQPDVFGYCGQLPQLMRGAGQTRFLTQKLSWNHFNRPHHHTFMWEGIDGSEVLAHFPPADTYNSVCDVEELRRAARDYKDHDRSRHAYLLFGHGDGGGGPTARMLEFLRRAGDLAGLPKVALRSPDEFFALLEEDCTDRARVIGELYFEFHRGTYTSQANTKLGNRRAEQALHDVELLAACADRLGAAPYPQAELERLWRVLLTQQFHDILPGSSIAEVYVDTERELAAVIAEADRLRGEVLGALGGGAAAPWNTLGVPRAEVALRDGAPVWIEAPACGPGRVVEAPDRVAVSRAGGGWVLENRHLRAEVSPDGSLASLVDRASGREALAARGNVLEIYDDQPTAWDAWDVDPFHLETRRECPPADSATYIDEGAPLRAAVAFERRVGARSRARQVLSLDAGARRVECTLEIDWQEDHKLLKVAFPIAVRAMNATYEVQFGALERPTHFNTTYDLARFEVPAHRFADLGEHGFGVAVLAHAKYGWSTFGSTVRLSLLRAPDFPAPGADRGAHAMRWAVMPHAGSWQDAGVVAEAARFDHPVVFAPAPGVRSFFSVDHPALVLDTVKRAEDSSALVLRLYEAHGSRGTARVTSTLPFETAVRTNLLEDDGGEALDRDGGTVVVPFRPYEVISLKLS